MSPVPFLIYSGGRLPSPAEFPSKGVLDTGVAERGRPFWLSSEVCNNARLHEMIKESMDYMMKSTYWNVDARATADIVAQSTSTYRSLKPTKFHKAMLTLESRTGR